MFWKIESKNRSQLAAEMLMEVIRSRQLMPGDRLPSEREISKEMGLSRNTLREAIAALQIMGVLEVRRSQGIFVLSTGYDGSFPSVISDIFSTNDDPFSVMDARIAFEPGAAITASIMASKGDLEDLKKRLERIQEAIIENDETSYFVEDRGFHLSIAQKTGNVFVISTISSLIQAMAQPLWRSMKKGLLETNAKSYRFIEHKNIYDAIASKDQSAIVNAFRIHLQNSKNRFVAEIDGKNG